MRLLRWIILGSLLLAACGAVPADSTPPPNPTSQIEPNDRPTGDANERATLEAEGVRVNRRVQDIEPIHPAQRIPKDGIRPIYEPEFQPADQAPLREDELVLGVAIDGDAKAYPISVLSFREMVNDQLAETPTLVTW